MATEKRMIDVNALITYFEGQCGIAAKDNDIESAYVLAALKCCIDLFQNFPTVDAVEVVRCKDCKHRADELDCGNYLCNRKMIGMVRPSDFCSFAERQTDG